MIRTLNESEKISALNPFGIRIKALHNAYCNTDICSFYIDTDSSSHMAKIGSVLILDGQIMPDENLLSDFCKMTGIKTILCSGELQFSIGCKSDGYILKYNGTNITFTDKKQKIVLCDNLRDIFPLLKNNMNDFASVTDFDEYYVDLSHRVRHGCAASSIVYDEENHAVSCAVAPFMCKEGAVISAVCTDEHSRNRGYASCAIYSLIDRIHYFGIENIYLQINDNSLFDFYYPLGFVAAGKWQEIIL